MYQKFLRRFGALYARIKKWSLKFQSYGCRPADSRPTKIHKRGFRCIRKSSYVIYHIRADSRCQGWSILGGKVFRKVFHNPTESKTYEILPIRRPAVGRPADSRELAGRQPAYENIQQMVSLWNHMLRMQCVTRQWIYWLNLWTICTKSFHRHS